MARLSLNSNTVQTLTTEPIPLPPYTISLWWKPLSVAGVFNQVFFASMGATGAAPYRWLYARHPTGGLLELRFFLVNQPATQQVFTTNGYIVGQWNHLALSVFNRVAPPAGIPEVIVLLNGDVANAFSDNMSPLIHGSVGTVETDMLGSTVGTAPPPHGDVESLAIWDTNLSMAELVSLSNRLAAPRVRQGNLVRWFPHYQQEALGGFNRNVSGTPPALSSGLGVRAPYTLT